MPTVQVFAPWAAFGLIYFWSLEVGVLFQFMPLSLPHSSAGVQLFGRQGVQSRLCPAPCLSRALPPALALPTHHPASTPVSPPWAPRPDCICPGSFPFSATSLLPLPCPWSEHHPVHTSQKFQDTLHA